MPNDDTNATIDPNPAQEPNDAWRQRGAKILQAIATAQLDPMYRFEIAEGFDDDDSMCQPDDDDYEPIQDIDPPVSDWEKCPHCNQRSVSISRHRRDSSRCNNCGPLECFSCECTLKRRNSEVTSAGFELYCPSCEREEREERARQQEHEEQLFYPQAQAPMRKGKTARDRENRAIRDRAKRQWKNFDLPCFRVRMKDAAGISTAVNLAITKIRLGQGGSCEIEYNGVITQPDLESLSVIPWDGQRAVVSSTTKTIPIFFREWRRRGRTPRIHAFTIDVKDWPEIKALLRDLGYLTPETRRTLGRLSGSERREEESLRATPTCEPRTKMRSALATAVTAAARSAPPGPLSARHKPRRSRRATSSFPPTSGKARVARG